jgi:hypothetical protein
MPPSTDRGSHPPRPPETILNARRKLIIINSIDY